MKKINIPIAPERIIGITLPEEDIVFICSYDEVIKVTLGNDITSTTLDDDPYEFLAVQSHVLGLDSHSLIHEKNGHTLSYRFNPRSDYVAVNYTISGEHGSINFLTFSGDWFAASFSDCGQYLVLAEPYKFEIYEI